MDWSTYQSSFTALLKRRRFLSTNYAKRVRIQYKRWCPVEDIEVPYQEIQKGYEIAKDNYALIEKQELENIKLKTTRTIDIKEFVDARELDPIFVQKSYYVAPDSKTLDKAYFPLVNILRNTDKVAIGKVVLRERAASSSSSMSKRYYHASLALS